MKTLPLAYDVYQYGDTNLEAHPIVFTHGILWNKFMYKEFAENVCKLTKRKVFCPDLRGHGESPRSFDVDIVFMVEDMKRFLKDLSLGKIIFMSHSFSATLAYLVAVDQPESVEKMIFIDHPPFKDFSKEFFDEHMYPQFTTPLRMLKALNQSMSLEEAKIKLESMGQPDNISLNLFMKKLAYDLVKENGVFKYNIDLARILERHKARGYHPNPRGRSDHEILIIKGQDSAWMDLKKFEEVKKHNPRARMVTLENATHLLVFEKMETFLDLVKNFLEGKHPDRDHIIIFDESEGAHLVF